MKTKLSILSMIVASSVFAFPVQAETTTPPTQNPNEFRQERQEHRSDVAQIHAQNLEKQFGNHYTHLTNIAKRIQSRIDILKGKGKDVTAAQAKLETAKASLESAKTLGDQAVAAFKAIDPAKLQEQKTQVMAARDLAVKARAAYVSALKDMNETVSILMTLKVEEKNTQERK